MSSGKVDALSDTQNKRDTSSSVAPTAETEDELEHFCEDVESQSSMVLTELWNWREVTVEDFGNVYVIEQFLFQRLRKQQQMALNSMKLPTSSSETTAAWASTPTDSSHRLASSSIPKGTLDSDLKTPQLTQEQPVHAANGSIVVALLSAVVLSRYAKQLSDKTMCFRSQNVTPVSSATRSNSSDPSSPSRDSLSASSFLKSFLFSARKKNIKASNPLFNDHTSLYQINPFFETVNVTKADNSLDQQVLRFYKHVAA